MTARRPGRAAWTTALLVALVATTACQTPLTVASPAPDRATARPTPTARATATPPRPSPATASPSPSPRRSPGACERATGGIDAGGALQEVRLGRHDQNDRIVFDFGGGRVPRYTVEPATSFQDASGRFVPVQGTVHWRIRFDGAGESGSYRGARTFARDAAWLVRELRVVEDFEGVLIWGLGLQRQACPIVSVLRSPDRLVVDLPR